MSDAAQEDFFLPFRLTAGGVSDDRQIGCAAAQPFDGPDALDAQQVNVENTSGGETMREQRFGFLNPKAVDDAVLPRIQTGTNGFREIRMSGQHQNGFHQFLNSQRLHESRRGSNHFTTLTRRSTET